MDENPQPDIERFAPDPSHGLSDEQVSVRVRQNLMNGHEEIKTKSVSRIVRDNLITPFNILNIILALLVLMVGSYKNLLFMGVIVCNTVIGIFQEIKAKKTIDKLSLISAPKAHIMRGGHEDSVPVSDIVLDDIMLLSSGDQICADCVIVDGECEADESLITGESDPVSKSRGGSLLSGSFIVSGKCRAKVEHVGSSNYAAKISSNAKYIKKPNSEILTWTNRIIKFTGIAIIPIGLLLFYKQIFISGQAFKNAIVTTVAALIGMIPEGLVLLTSVVFAVSVIRLSMHKALVQELYSVETLAHVDTLCLDKTGTITEGSLQVDKVVPLCDISRDETEKILSSLSAALNDNTPTMNAVKAIAAAPSDWICVKKTAFSSARKWSGASFEGKGSYILGAGEFILRDRFAEIKPQVEKYSRRGERVLLLAYSKQILNGKDLPADIKPMALIALSDKIRRNAKKTLNYFSDQGVDIKVISGDNPLTVSNIAAKAGLKNADRFIDASSLKNEDDVKNAAVKYTVFGRVTPKQKLELVRALKEQDHTVAMTGDGVNDVPALKESDCSIAMASGSDAARTVSQIVLLNSDFASMPRIVAEGRRSINNLQRSASLFLVKAIFSAIIAVMFIFLSCDYPFQPIQFTLINAVTIGIPSFFLALEPNHERLNGKFILNVVKKALPGALTMSINILFLVSISEYLKFSNPEISTIAVLLTGYTGLLILFKVCMPFNAKHAVLFVSMAAVFVLALVLYGQVFEIVSLTPSMIFMLIPLMLFSTSLMAVMLHLISKIIK